MILDAQHRTLFDAKVVITDSCRLWTGAVNSKGYGCVSIGGRRHLAHRVSYETFVGPIPPGLTLDHVAERCSSKLCVRPDHLEVVTRAENSRRRAAQITHCPLGHELTFKAGDKQRRCRPCEAVRNRARRARLSEAVA